MPFWELGAGKPPDRLAVAEPAGYNAVFTYDPADFATKGVVNIPQEARSSTGGDLFDQNKGLFNSRGETGRQLDDFVTTFLNKASTALWTYTAALSIEWTECRFPSDLDPKEGDDEEKIQRKRKEKKLITGRRMAWQAVACMITASDPFRWALLAIDSIDDSVGEVIGPFVAVIHRVMESDDNFRDKSSLADIQHAFAKALNQYGLPKSDPPSYFAKILDLVETAIADDIFPDTKTPVSCRGLFHNFADLLSGKITLAAIVENLTKDHTSELAAA